MHLRKDERKIKPTGLQFELKQCNILLSTLLSAYGAVLHKNSFPQIEYYVKAPFFLLIF